VRLLRIIAELDEHPQKWNMKDLTWKNGMQKPVKMQRRKDAKYDRRENTPTQHNPKFS